MAINFASDNCSGVHVDIMKAISEANSGYEISYGEDQYTEKAVDLFKQEFGNDIDVMFVLTGTAANLLGLSCLIKSYHAVICADTAHINVDECGAPEKILGCKLLSVLTEDGKLTVANIHRYLHAIGVEHHSQPKVVSITQATEYGTVYTLEEIKDICDFAHNNGLYVHMDGARIANAAVTLDCNLKSMILDTGVDVLSFGGTKNGLMYGEAVIFFNSELSVDAKYIRKQNMQLISKMRYLSSQFIPYLENKLWFLNAEAANSKATYFAKKLSQIDGVNITKMVQGNAIFLTMPKLLIPIMQKAYYFYIWDESNNEVRLMTSFDTPLSDIDNFVELMKQNMK